MGSNLSNSNIQVSSSSALESLLKITNVLKESLGVSSEKSTSSNESTKYNENSVSSNETINQSKTTNTTPKTISYNYGSYILTVNPTTKTTITSYVPKTSSYIKPVEIPVIIAKKSYTLTPASYFQPKIEDLLTKGKLTFEQKVVISYQYSYNLQNIIPNPLYNKYINDKYNDDNYATGDLDGEINTTYLKFNKNNISNKISKDYYIPAIGELGISMENIQKINDSIEALGEEYSEYKIPYDSIIASSSLYSQTKIMNSDYNIANNINNVWCFNNNNAEISYRSISTKFTIIPFYKFENNIKINLDEDIEDVIVNSIVSLEKYDPNMYYEQNLPISNYQTMIKNISDFTVDNWLSHPFNPKYFFNITFPEVKDYIKQGDNFIKLHDNYLSYYEYYGNYIKYNIKDYNNSPDECTYETPLISICKYNDLQLNSYMGIENNEFVKKNLVWNNGVSYASKLIKRYDYISYVIPTGGPDDFQNPNYQFKPGTSHTYLTKWISNNEVIAYSYTYYNLNTGPGDFFPNYEYTNAYISYQLQTCYDEYWKHILMYNVPIYNNHLVLTPIYGSGEQIYNIKKNKAKSIFYVTLPYSCSKFECKMNNTSDCEIIVSKYLEIYGFVIYCVTLNFKVDVPTDNILIFSCYYRGKQITKKYFYTIYSLLLSNSLYNTSDYTTYFNIENYYVAKDLFYWWQINKWSYLPNKSELYQSPIIQYSGGSGTYQPSIRKVSTYDGFGKLFDRSFNNISNRFIAYLTYIDINGRAQVDPNTYWLASTPYNSFNSYTYNKYNSAFENLSHTSFNGMYDMSYLINTISRNIGIKDNGTVQDRGLRVDRMIDNDIIDNSNLYDREYNNTSYIINTLSYIINDHETYTLSKGIYSNIFYEPKYEFKYIENWQYQRPILTNNYHIFTINTNINNPNADKHKLNGKLFYLQTDYYNDALFYKPIIRINRNIDDFGIYNDLIFTYIPKYYGSNRTQYYPSNYMEKCDVSIYKTDDYINYEYGQTKLFKIKGKNGEFTYLNTTNYNYNTEGNNDYKTPYLYTLERKQYYDSGLNTTSTIPGRENSKIRINVPIVGAKQSICLGMDMVEYVKIGLFRKVLTDNYGRIYNKQFKLARISNDEYTRYKINYELKFRGDDTNNWCIFENGFNENIKIYDDADFNQKIKSSGWYYNLKGDELRIIYRRFQDVLNEHAFLFDYTYYYNYIFSDYLFLYNNTNTIVSLLISDPSLTLINKQYAQIQLKPYEFKVYYPSNFNYNDTNNFNKSNIYTIKIINKTPSISNIEFEYLKLGEYNLSFDEMYDIFVEDNSHLIEYLNSSNIIEVGENEYPKFRLNGIMGDQIGYKLVTNLLGLYHKYDENNPYSKDQILSFYYNILSYKNNMEKNPINPETYYKTSLSKAIHNKIIDNKINILSSYINTLNINIQNYSENKAGHLVIINSGKKFENNSTSINLNDISNMKWTNIEAVDPSVLHDPKDMVQAETDNSLVDDSSSSWAVVNPEDFGQIINN